MHAEAGSLQQVQHRLPPVLSVREARACDAGSTGLVLGGFGVGGDGFQANLDGLSTLYHFCPSPFMLTTLKSFTTPGASFTFLQQRSLS